MAKKTNSIGNTGEIVLSALKKLMKNTGWTTRTITKFIKVEYQISDQYIGRKIARALKRGVKLGLLHNEKGRYRLSDMSRLARPASSTEKRIRIRLRQNARANRPLRIRRDSPSCSRRK